MTKKTSTGLASPGFSKPVLHQDRVKLAVEFAGADKTAGGSRPLSEPGRRSGLIPEGDVRLTANISAELHKKLKIISVQRETTIGEMIEEWVRSL